jgi:hypothetical protein
MLCVAAQHDPPGYVASAGLPLKVRDISLISSADIRICTRLLDELASNKVFEQDADGMISSRRMIRDWQQYEKAREFGKRGGNPRIAQPPKTLKGTLKGDRPLPLTPRVNGGVGPITRDLESRKKDSSSSLVRAQRPLTPQAPPARPSPSEASKINGHPQPTSGPATALPDGRAGPPVEGSKASEASKTSKKPSELTKAEFEEHLTKRRTGGP